MTGSSDVIGWHNQCNYPTLGLTLLAGRDFSSEYSADWYDKKIIP